MKVHVLLWAQMRIAAGTGRVELELRDGAPLREALSVLYETHPTLAPHRAAARVAIGTEYAGGDEALREGDEISLIPPVQGG
jgi:molybdopterin converting factor small subunit